MSLLRRVVLLVLLAAAPGSVARAADDRDDPKGQMVVKTEQGLHFTLPADWPVEKRGGAVGPIPIEEYISRKFTAMDTRLRTLEQQITSMDLRVRFLEEEFKKRQPLQSVEKRP